LARRYDYLPHGTHTRDLATNVSIRQQIWPKFLKFLAKIDQIDHQGERHLTPKAACEARRLMWDGNGQEGAVCDHILVRKFFLPNKNIFEKKPKSIPKSKKIQKKQKEPRQRCSYCILKPGWIPESTLDIHILTSPFGNFCQQTATIDTHVFFFGPDQPR